MEEHIGIKTHKPKPILDSKAVLLPFQLELWIALLTILVLMAVIFFLLDHVRIPRFDYYIGLGIRPIMKQGSISI